MAEMNPREMQQALAQPFAPEDLEWRIQTTSKDKTRGMAVPYVTNRAIQTRLDEVWKCQEMCSRETPKI